MSTKKTTQKVTSNLMVVAFFLFGGLFYLFYPFIQNYSATPKWVFVSSFCLVLLFLGKKTKIAWSLAIGSWFLFVSHFLIQSYFSYNFWDAVIRTTPFFLAPIAVLLLRKEAADTKEFYSKIALVISMLILPILLITLLELTALILGNSYSHLSTYSFRFTFGNRNQYCELLVLMVPLLFAGIHFTDEKVKKRILYTTLLLIYLTVTILLNRASILVIYGVYPFFYFLFFIQKFGNRNKKFGFGLLLLIILCGGIFGMSSLRKQIPIVQNLVETRHGSGNERIQIWKNSIDLFKQSPIFGKGSGDWKIEILTTPLGFTKAEESTIFYQRAHNDFIQIAVENGILGLALFLAFFVIGLVLLFKSDISTQTKILLSSGVVGYIFLSNFSFPMEKIELLLLLFLFLVPGLKRGTFSIKNKGYQLIAYSLLLFGILGLSTFWLINEKRYFIFKANGDQQAFSEIKKDFYSIDPTTTPIYWHEGNTFYNQKNYIKALQSFKQALKQNPNHAHVLNNLGSCHYALGNLKETENYYKRALTINPKFVETLMNYSSFLFNNGDIDGALNHILAIPNHKEPPNYILFIQTIAKAKYNWMMELHDDPPFEQFLKETISNNTFLYEISKKARISGNCYEDELRDYFASI